MIREAFVGSFVVNFVDKARAKAHEKVSVKRLILALALLCSVAAAGSLDLASALFAEKQWGAAGLVSRRVLAADPPPAEADSARLLSALSTLRLSGEERQPALQTLEALWMSESAAIDLRCRAAYELALARTAQDQRRADDALIFAYSHAQEIELFWQAGCVLYLQFQANRAWRRQNPELWRTLQTSSRAWPADLVREQRERIATKRPSWSRLPARGVVSFYRAQIAPAIGSRCELQPSCSAYMLEACQAHGLLGYALMADRFIREPSVYNARRQLVVLPDGRIKIADPLTDHDFWMKETR